METLSKQPCLKSLSTAKEPSMSLPEYHQQEDFKVRSTKLAEIRKMGIEPYPHKFTPTHTALDLQKDFAKKELTHDEAQEGKTPKAVVAGRLVLFRAMGKNAFGHIQDESGRIQIMFNRDQTKVEGLDPEKAEITPIKFIEKKLDLGDILGVEGNLFYTQKGELTLFAKKVTLLTKTLLPLPDKHAGLSDKGVRYRKRWLDLISEPDSAQRFFLRSKVLKIIRHFMEDQDFMEVETPIVQNIYGGAEARPFMTHLNALDQEMYLRIALEISLKKLVVGSLKKVYEIGKIFRNEGIDRTHNPEFTMMEAYAPYWDYSDMRKLVENLYAEIAKKLTGSTKVTVFFAEKETEIDLTPPWTALTMKEALEKYVQIDTDSLSDEELKKLLIKEANIEEKDLKGLKRGSLITMCFEEFAEKHLIQPHHIIDYPIETSPLAKPHRDPELKKQGIIERFESYVLATEVANSYSELNDPELQRKLLEEQAKLLSEGNEEAHPIDEEFLESICQGMPPTAGLGIGIDRLVMLFTNAPSIRDVIYFPLMKPEHTS